MMVLQIESPNPVPWAKLFTLTKRSEYPVHLVRCNAHTRIGDVECYILAFPAIPVTDVPAGGELEGIAYQIGNDLENPVLVSINPRYSRPEFCISVPLPSGQRKICVVYLARGWRRTGVMVNSTMPDSIFDKSRISLMSWSRRSLFDSTIS